jgi:P2 family phage contractile tail tube protein
MSGIIKSVEPGAWKAGEKSTLTFTVALRAYKYEQNGVTIDEIDVINFVRKVGGVDRLAAQRNAIGI